MQPAQPRVEPGATVATTVTVRNRGTQVERVRLAVTGPVSGLAQVSPPELSVFPDDEQTAEVRFTAPRAPWPPAGRAPFQVEVRSEVHRDVGARAAGTLTIGRFDQLGATLDPETTRGRAPGRHTVTLVNQGNAPRRAAIRFTDRDGELSYAPPNVALQLAPGATVVGSVLVGGAVRWFGRVQSMPFTATVTADPAPGAPVVLPPTLLNGVRRQLPRLPWWIPTAAVVLVAVVIAVLALRQPPRVPAVTGMDGPATLTALEKAGYVGQEIQTPDPATPAGQTVRTDPAAGTAFKKGERVLYFVSVGPCVVGACPIKVPNVVGLSVVEAQKNLQAAQFVVQRVNRQPDAVQPVDTVLATSPGPNEQATLGTQIVLTASSGPAGPPPLPTVAGLSVAAATAKLKALGLTAIQAPVRTNQVAVGTVVGTVPPVGAPLAPGSTVTVQVAENTPLLDLLGVAPSGRWAANTGPLTFPGGDQDGRGFVLIDPAATLEDGSTVQVLETHPEWQPAGFITGTLTLPAPVIAGDHLRATVGFLADSGDDTASFIVSVGGKDLKKVDDRGSDGKLRNVDVDLTPVAGATDIVIKVVAGKRANVDANEDRTVWKDLRIEPKIG